MREIEFRGKRIDNGKWVHGYYKFNDRAQIADDCFYWHNVIRATAGQYTGLNDNHGKKIFEGDIVRYNETPYEVSEFFGSYMLQRVDNEVIDYSDFPLSIFSCDSYEMKFVGSKNDYCVSFYELADNQQDVEGSLNCQVIGNIHDNPELAT